VFGLLKPIFDELREPKLRNDGELTAYVTKMQRAQVEVSFRVVCSHIIGRKHRSTIVTHRSSHPFTYLRSTDKSTLTKNWQQPAGRGGGDEDGSLGTGIVAVVSSGLSWSAAKGKTADKLKAERRRLYDENKHRDKRCDVRVEVTLPGRLPTQLYAPADARFSGRLSPVAVFFGFFLGLGVPLYFYYDCMLSKRVEHTVHKIIYIDGHAAGTDEQLQLQVV
jgi:hypothetical protein